MEIDEQFSMGRHYVGDWHTHPERRPRPSKPDLSSMRRIARQSKHELPGLLLVIIGTKKTPDDMWVSLHDGADIRGIRLVTA